MKEARFNGTVFMTVNEFNGKPATDRRNIDGKCFARHDGKWMQVNFRKAKPASVAVKKAA